MLGIDVMRELDLNNKDQQKARMSIYQHYDDLEEQYNINPMNKVIASRIKITSLIIANIDVLWRI